MSDEQFGVDAEEVEVVGDNFKGEGNVQSNGDEVGVIAGCGIELESNVLSGEFSGDDRDISLGSSLLTSTSSISFLVSIPEDVTSLSFDVKSMTASGSVESSSFLIIKVMQLIMKKLFLLLGLDRDHRNRWSL